MKTNPVAGFRIIKKAFYFFLLSIVLIKCKKDDVLLSKAGALKSNSVQKNDGIITVKTGILPPVTQRSFIVNGDNSIAQFQIISARPILLRRLDFVAPVKFITSTKINKIYDYKVLNDSGSMTYFINNFLTVGTGASLNMIVYYKPVKSATSGSFAQVTLKHISYVSEDNVMHDFYPAGDNKSKQMCLVYNVPGIKFQNPSGGVYNKMKEIAEVKLSGDTNWILRALPVNIFSSKDYDGSIPKSKLVVQTNNVNVVTQSDSVRVKVNGSARTVIHFTGGFQHIKGKTEILKIYAPVRGTNVNIVSVMAPYNLLEWSDGLGTIFKGGENDKFYKLNPGFSSYTYHW